ncbi:HU family DNA-binding protein [Candidatus Woesearchaeota archaeon]|nr:HU family DNA-binding protein [Candidatus Woesearchaeota archaeon]
MNKGELVDAVAKETGQTKADAERALNAVLGNISKGVKKDPVQLVGFGTFKIVKTKARKGINPQTKEAIKIPSKKVLKFKASANPKY